MAALIDGVDANCPDSIQPATRASLLLCIHRMMRQDKDKLFAWIHYALDLDWLPMQFSLELSLLVSSSVPVSHLTPRHLAFMIGRTKSRNPTTSDMVRGCVKTALILSEMIEQASSFIEAVVGMLLQVLMSDDDHGLTPSGHARKLSSFYPKTLNSIQWVALDSLTEIFEACEPSRKRILSSCLMQLTHANKDARSFNATIKMMSLLHRLVQRNTTSIGQHYLEDVQQALLHLTWVPSVVGMQLIVALAPLCVELSDFQSHAASSLKRAMLSRDLRLRLLGTRGFLYLIYSQICMQMNTSADAANPAPTKGPLDTDTESMEGLHGYSQAYVPCLSQMDALTGGCAGSVTLLHELAGFMRRGLQQEQEVRQLLYQAIPILLSADPAAAETIAEVLMTQIEDYFVLNDSSSLISSDSCGSGPSPAQSGAPLPINLQACIASAREKDDVTVVEPLHCLLSCVHKTLQIGQGLSATLPMTALEALVTKMHSIRDTLCEAPLEEYRLIETTKELGINETQNQNQNQRSTAPVSIKKQPASLLLACYEAMMECVITGMGDTALEGEIEMLSALFSHHQRLSKLLWNKRASALLETKCLGGQYHKMGSASLKRLLNAIMNDCFADVSISKGGEVPDGEKCLVRDSCFQLFVLQTCYTTLTGQRDKHQSVALLVKKLEATNSSSIHGTAMINALFNVDAELLEDLVQPIIQCTRMFILAGAREQCPTGPKRRIRKKGETVTMGMLLEASVQLLIEVLLHVCHAAGSNTIANSWEEKVRDALFLGTPDSQSTSHIKDIFYALVDHACCKELEKLTRCLDSLLSSQSTDGKPLALNLHHAKELSRWLDYAYSSAPSSCSSLIGVAKSLVTCRLQSHYFILTHSDPNVVPPDQEPLGMFTALEQLFRDIKAMDTSCHSLISQKTVGHIAAIGLAFMDQCITHLHLELPRNFTPVNKQTTRQLCEAPRKGWFERAFGLIRVSAAAAECHVYHGDGQGRGEPMSYPQVVKNLYKTLTAATKCIIQAHRKGNNGKEKEGEESSGMHFGRLANLVHGELTPKIYSLKAELQRATNNPMDLAMTRTKGMFQQKERQFGDEVDPNSSHSLLHNRNPSGKGSTLVPQKRKRQHNLAKALPDLVFAIEEWEQQAIKLSQVWMINLMQNAKRSSNWDFRVLQSRQ